MKSGRVMVVVALCLLAWASPAWSWDLNSSLKEGTVDLKSGGPLAFGPDGVLFVGDPEQAAIFAVATGDTSGNPEAAKVEMMGVEKELAAALGAKPADILVNDMAVNPASGNVYLSVSRGRGPDAATVLLRLATDGKISELSLKNVKHAKADLPNPPAPGGTGRRNQRAMSITDLTYADGRLLVAGLSSEEFASTLRAIPVPFKEVGEGTSVEIFHGAHGRFETRSPVRTFATYSINKQPHLLAAYTCTPLVKFPLSDLKSGAKIKGTTVAELGNRNRPLDMIVYNKGGEDFVLMANSSRGVMKITTEGLDRKKGIEERISDKAGQTYETLDELKGVVQLDRLNSKNALLLVQNQDSGALSLKTIALP